MRFLADMGVSQRVVTWLRGQGHDVLHLRDEQLQRLPDEDVFAKAVNEQRIILTFDLDFAEILAFAGDETASVIVFRLVNASPDNVMARLDQVLKSSADDLEQGVIISVEDFRYRIRRFPVSTLH
jgi:predicted nuclease of predicted toxin-antitoxin system